MRGRSQRALLGLLIAFGVTLVGSVAIAESRRAAVAERPSTHKLSDALVRVLDARLSLAKWRLEKLTGLHARGYASWRECAEQRAAIETGEAQRQAVEEFAAFLRAIDEQALRCNTVVNAVAAAHRPGHVVKLTLPGSVRLVAWMEAEEMPGTLADFQHQPANPSASQDSVRQLQHQVAAAENRVAGLARIAGRSGVAEELRREECTLAIARAELDFAQLSSQAEAVVRLEAGKVRNTAAAVATTIAADKTSPRLRHAALRVAAAEARAGGALRMSEIGVQRAELLVDSFWQLHARGFATAREVQNAEQELSAAKAAVEQRRLEQSRLVEAFELLRMAQRSEQEDGNENEVVATALPRELLSHRPAVMHLIALRLQACLATASKASAAARLRLLEELDRRMGSRSSNAGQRNREDEFAEIDIAYCRAEVLAAAERCEALRLEERRFLEQFRQSSPFNARLVAYVDNSLRDSDSNSRSELATLGRSLQIDRLGLVTWPPSESVAEGLTSLAATGFITAPLSTLGLSSRSYLRSNAAVTPSSLATSANASYYPFDRPPPAPSVFRVPVYADYYQFGNLRPDMPKLENRATSYGGPWFYPGASTNFR